MHAGCLYVRARQEPCMYVCMLPRNNPLRRTSGKNKLLPRNISGKVHVGGNIFCRRSSMGKYQDLEPEWRNLGPLGTAGMEGETAEQDIPETWGWTLSDVTLQTAAVEAHLRGQWL